MDTFEAIRSRRSVKKFDPAHKMSEDEIRQLFELVVLSPTSYNIQNWRFVAVTDDATKRAIKVAGWHQSQFSDCSLLVVVCGDREAYGQDPARYWANATEETRQAVVPMILGAYGKRPDLRRDENLRSGSLAAQTLMLAARAMGYDSCPMVGFDFTAVGEIIGLPAEHDIVMAVTVGMALEPARPRGGQLPLDEVVHRDRFPGR